MRIFVGCCLSFTLILSLLLNALLLNILPVSDYIYIKKSSKGIIMEIVPQIDNCVPAPQPSSAIDNSGEKTA